MRGQIWYVNKGKKYMERSGGARPAIVVSEDTLNNKTNRVMVVYLTTHEYEHEEKVPVTVKGNPSYAVCDNINTVFKDELSGCAGTVDDETMQKIEEQMAKSLGIGSKDKAFDILSFAQDATRKWRRMRFRRRKWKLHRKRISTSAHMKNYWRR